MLHSEYTFSHKLQALNVVYVWFIS